MSETLPVGREYDSIEPLIQEYIPSPEIQRDIFCVLLDEGSQQHDTPRLLKGPHYNPLVAIMKAVEADIKAIDQHFTPEYIISPEYQTREVKEYIETLSSSKQAELTKVSERRFERIDGVVADRLANALRRQGIRRGALDEPPYHGQGEDWDHADAAKGCSSACFRMLFDGLVGWAPSETVVAQELTERYGTSVVDDHVYSGILQSNAFKDLCRRQVVTLEMIGADFMAIQAIATKMKARQPEATIYCTLSLASKMNGKDVWHSGILLNAGSERVSYLDPMMGSTPVTESYADFIPRWAVAYNRARLTIAA